MKLSRIGKIGKGERTEKKNEFVLIFLISLISTWPWAPSGRPVSKWLVGVSY